MKKIKNDVYRKSRGGYSVLLDLYCTYCNELLFSYQKDGPGPLKRLYLDRISNSNIYQNLQSLSPKSIPQLSCPNCNETIGVLYVYKPESRFAYRLIQKKKKKKESR